MKALQGLRVIDLSRVLAGPYCGQLLADMGADVIKIEGLEGDENRKWPPFMKDGESSNFQSVNRGKKGLALNLKSPAAQDILRRLAAKADVLLHSFLPGTAARLGVDEDGFQKANPRLIVCSISGYGFKGELREKPGYDLMVQAFSGIMSVTGYEGTGPVRTGVSFIDMSTGLSAYAGIVTAVLARQTTGRGTTVRASLLESALSWHGYHLVACSDTDFVPKPEGSGVWHIVPYQAFKCSDGYLLAGATNDPTFKRFCEAIEMPHLALDERFQGPQRRVANRDILIPILEACFVNRRVYDMYEKFEALKVPTAPVHTIDQIIKHPQVVANDMMLDFDTERGPIKLVGTPFKVEEGGGVAGKIAPKLGADTDEILADLDFTKAEIEKLRKDDVI
jgi:crotonobetainyl-CoA:carnitine CoA-transferase CaiB-like acyl-CoA transferase